MRSETTFLRRGFVLPSHASGDLEIVTRNLGAIARSAPDVLQPRPTAEDTDFGVANCDGVFAVHADGKWAFLRQMRAVQPPQPNEAASRASTLGLLKSSTTHLLGSGFVETG